MAQDRKRHPFEHKVRETQPGYEFGQRFYSEAHRWPRFQKLYSLPQDVKPFSGPCDRCNAPVAYLVQLNRGRARAVTLDLDWEWHITRKNAEGVMTRWTIRHKCRRRI